MEVRLFKEGSIPEYTTPEWYAGRENAPHLEQEGHRERLFATAEAIARVNPASVVDLGAGDGGLLYLLRALDYRCWGYDLQSTNVVKAINDRKVDVVVLDVVSNMYEVAWGELAVATEMLEHLIDPHKFVRDVANHSEWFVASSPWHETENNHYEFHTWAWDDEGFENMINAAGFETVEHFRVQGAQVFVGRQ